MPDMSKKHNYYIVDDENQVSHYLDRYNTNGEPTTLCGKPVKLSEVEHDELGYLDSIDCLDCYGVLTSRVLAVA